MTTLLISAREADRVRETVTDFLAENAGAEDVHICFEPGDYYFHNPQAVQTWREVLRGETDADTLWGRAGLPYHTEMVLRGLKRVTVAGRGATLWMEGLTAPLTAVDCEAVTLTGFTVAWREPHFTLARVLGSADGVLTLAPFLSPELRGGEYVWGLYDWDPQTREVCRVYKFRGMSPLEKGPAGVFTLGVGSVAARIAPGATLILRHVGNYRPVLHFLRSRGVRVQDVTVTGGPGMGVIAHACRDLAFERFRVVPLPGRVLSTNTDSTHFISCAGVIDLTDCEFEGAGDDAVNVHGFYLKVDEILDDHTLRAVSLRDNGTQDQVCDAPAAGATVALYRAGSQEEYAEARVVRADVDERAFAVTLTLDGPTTPAFMPGDMLTQVSDLASLRMRSCRVYAQRARAVLSQTRNVLIENCRFATLSGTAVHVTSDIAEGWYESVAADHVVIRGNTMVHCGYGDGTYQRACGVAVESGEKDDSVAVHRRILLEDNRIVGPGSVGVAVMNAGDVTLRRNDIAGCGVAVDVCASDGVTLEDNDYHAGCVRFARGHVMQNEGK